MLAALAALDAERANWRALLAAIAAAVGLAAAENLLSDWRDAQYIDDAYAYDPSDDPDSALSDYLDTIAPGNGDRIVTATRAALWALFKAAAAGGILALLDALDEQYATWQDGRAGVMARGAVVPAWNMAELDTADGAAADGAVALSGAGGELLVIVKTWVTVGDNRVRPAHDDADGQLVAVVDTFTVGGEELAYPGDPSGSASNTEGCRCSALYDLLPAAYVLDEQTASSATELETSTDIYDLTAAE